MAKIYFLKKIDTGFINTSYLYGAKAQIDS